MGGSTRDLPGSPRLLPLPRCRSLRLAGRTGSIALLTGAPGAPATRRHPRSSRVVAFLCPAKPCGPFGGTAGYLPLRCGLVCSRSYLKMSTHSLLFSHFYPETCCNFSCATGEGREEKVEGGLRGRKRRESKSTFLLFGKRRVSEDCPCPETFYPKMILVGNALLPSFSMEKAKIVMLVWMWRGGICACIQ